MNIDEPLITDVPALRRLWQEAFGDTDELLDAFYKTAFRTDHCRCIRVDNEIAAALYWFDCLHRDKHIAYLYAMATASVYRGQGFCHKLMEDTHTHLTCLCYEGVLLVPGNQALFKLYESMGYRTCSYIRKFYCTSEIKQGSLRLIDKTDYARLRRQWLPMGGVVQENKNLDFLQTQVAFYAGSNFLLAAHGKADTLYGVELLGDRTAAPGILHDLGYAKGIFRTPGGDIPFAMYHPLGDSKLPPPSYFGLAFD